MQMKLYILLVAVLLCPFVTFSQGRVSRSSQPKTQKSNPKKSASPLKVSDPDGFINSHGYVDLGLPSGIKWANCNVGSSKANGNGSYYSWGETHKKSNYVDSPTHGKNINQLNTNGFIDESGNLIMSYDVANVQWGYTCRIPTKEELEELLDKCIWKWISENSGYQVTGPNGKSIFLPAAGWWNGNTLDASGMCGGYWSSTPCVDYNTYSFKQNFHSEGLGLERGGRTYGYTIRAVSQ